MCQGNNPFHAPARVEECNYLGIFANENHGEEMLVEEDVCQGKNPFHPPARVKYIALIQAYSRMTIQVKNC